MSSESTVLSPQSAFRKARVSCSVYRETRRALLQITEHGTRNTERAAISLAMAATNQIASSPSLAATNALREIKPPVVIANPWEWLWWSLGALALGITLFELWRWWQKRRAQIAIVPPVPAHVRAKQKLAEALALLAQPKPFCTLVSDTVRFYLEERFEFRAPERTTEEFLHELRGTNLLLPDQKESLGAFLQSCDLVKFAKYEPGEPELRGMQESALRLVEETELQPMENSSLGKTPDQVAVTK